MGGWVVGLESCPVFERQTVRNIGNRRARERERRERRERESASAKESDGLVYLVPSVYRLPVPVNAWVVLFTKG